MNQIHVIKILISVRKKKSSSHSLWSMDAGTEIVGLGDRRRHKALTKKDAYGSKYKLLIFLVQCFIQILSLSIRVSNRPLQGNVTTL